MSEPHLAHHHFSCPSRDFGCSGPTNTAYPTQCSIQPAAQFASAQSHTAPSHKAGKCYPAEENFLCYHIPRGPILHGIVPRPTEVSSKSQGPSPTFLLRVHVSNGSDDSPAFRDNRAKLTLALTAGGPSLPHLSLRLGFLRTGVEGWALCQSRIQEVPGAHAGETHWRVWQWLIGLLLGH